ncbi:MAG: hypothetical protein CM15mP42_12800 [Methanobacteriota archaeon]|nr:MAG: hypothetical protein CM15mP42_12800 [Euryarchaeota archaeon]
MVIGWKMLMKSIPIGVIYDNQPTSEDLGVEILG